MSTKHNTTSLVSLILFGCYLEIAFVMDYALNVNDSLIIIIIPLYWYLLSFVVYSFKLLILIHFFFNLGQP